MISFLALIIILVGGWYFGKKAKKYFDANCTIVFIHKPHQDSPTQGVIAGNPALLTDAVVSTLRK